MIAAWNNLYPQPVMNSMPKPCSSMPVTAPSPSRSIWSIARIVLAPRVGDGAEYTHSTYTRCKREAFHGITRRAHAHVSSWLWFSAELSRYVGSHGGCVQSMAIAKRFFDLQRDEDHCR